MDSDLTKLLMDKLSQSPNIQKPSFNDQMSSLVDEFEKRKMGSRMESAFQQIMDKTGGNSILQEDSFQAQQTLKGVVKKETLLKGFGASIAGSIGGIISGFLPINLGIQGVPQIIGGVVLNKVAKGSTGSAISEGVVIAGAGLAISGLLGGSLSGLLGNIGGRSTTPSPTSGVMF